MNLRQPLTQIQFDPHVLTSETPSPCISVCDLQPDSGLCTGCQRTLDEIMVWGTASDSAKRRIWQVINQRRSQLFHE